MEQGKTLVDAEGDVLRGLRESLFLTDNPVILIIPPSPLTINTFGFSLLSRPNKDNVMLISPIPDFPAVMLIGNHHTY